MFDILAWNNDSTKMPGAMRVPLRNFYVRNLLAGQLECGSDDRPLLDQVERLPWSAQKSDHIVPWQSA